MTYKEIIENAKDNMGFCKACIVCNGKVCKNSIPGPGAKGVGDVAIRNYDKWQNIRLNMDTICENKEISTEFDFLGKKFKYPIFSGPIGAVEKHYGDKYTEEEYNNIMLKACNDSGILAFTGDGVNSNIMIEATKQIKKQNGMGIPTVKPWSINVIEEKLKLVKDSNAFAFAMDIDAAGLPFLKNLTPKAGSKTVEELREIKQISNLPFIIKGIMTAKGALKAIEANADAIVVSNHGGRVLDQTPATAEVLPEIVEAVDSFYGGKKNRKIKILVDGGIRTGADILKALAIGADGVLIARTFVIALYGGGYDGVVSFANQLGSELEDAMSMCGVHSLADIDKSIVRIL